MVHRKAKRVASEPQVPSCSAITITIQEAELLSTFRNLPDDPTRAALLEAMREYCELMNGERSFE